MTGCQLYQEQLAEYAAAGEPAAQEFTALRAHLAVCPFCRAEIARLRRVEVSLHIWPLARLPHDLVQPVMIQIAREPQDANWELLPWTLWVPALAIALALGLVLATNLRGYVLPAGAPLTTIPAPSALPTTEALHRPLSVAGSELFWAIWCGLFITLAGIGISLGLMSQGNTLHELSGDLRERWEHLRQAARL